MQSESFSPTGPNAAPASLLELERKCADHGLRMTAQRRAVLRVLARSADHPSAAEIHRRAREADAAISIATVYRNISALEAAGVIERHAFRTDGARYEMSDGQPHDHLVDLESGEILEFRDDDLERMKSEIARALGYRLVDCRVTLYGRPRAKGP